MKKMHLNCSMVLYSVAKFGHCLFAVSHFNMAYF